MSLKHDLSKEISQYINSTQNTTCRLCLKRYDPVQLGSIFNSFENITVAEYVTNFAKILITREDCFSKVVCKYCVGKLNYIEDFRKKIYGCNEYLNRLYTVYIESVEQAELNDVNKYDKIPSPDRQSTEISKEKVEFGKEEESDRINDLQNLEGGEEDTKIDIIEHVLVKTESPAKIENYEMTVIKPKRKREKGPHLQFPCNQCDRTYKHKKDRNRHLKTHTQREYYECETCQKKFLNKNSLMEHVKIHIEDGAMKMKCKECGKQFMSIYTLEQHMETHTDTPKYQCDVCGKRFSHPKSFTYHKQCHQLKMTEHKCEICNKIIRSRFPQALIGHMKIHSNTLEKSCPECGKTFKSLEGYEGHLRKHNNELEFKCDECPKQFASRNGLRQHRIAVHTALKRHQCEICNKAFSLKGHLFEHGKVHAKENPVTCTICEKQYGLEDHLKDHMRVAHGILFTTL